jgi:hypothetical protein
MSRIRNPEQLPMLGPTEYAVLMPPSIAHAGNIGVKATERTSNLGYESNHDMRYPLNPVYETFRVTKFVKFRKVSGTVPLNPVESNRNSLNFTLDNDPSVGGMTPAMKFELKSLQEEKKTNKKTVFCQLNALHQQKDKWQNCCS